jgi:hypothetical protein
MGSWGHLGKPRTHVHFAFTQSLSSGEDSGGMMRMPPWTPDLGINPKKKTPKPRRR